MRGCAAGVRRRRTADLAPRGVTGDHRGMACAHLDATADADPDPSTTAGCTECLREGTSWVHLRECLECGHVGCCDSSPRTHATAHFHATDHPVIRSFEPGETWRWCYVDEDMAAV